MTSLSEERDAFVAEYTGLRRRINDAAMAKAKAKAKPKAKPKARAKVEFRGEIPQAAARTYLPEHASIWKSPAFPPRWCAHVPPRARISEPYGGNEAMALALILRRVWAQHCELVGATMESTPFEFVLE